MGLLLKRQRDSLGWSVGWTQTAGRFSRLANFSQLANAILYRVDTRYKSLSLRTNSATSRFLPTSFEGLLTVFNVVARSLFIYFLKCFSATMQLYQGKCLFVHELANVTVNEVPNGRREPHWSRSQRAASVHERCADGDPGNNYASAHTLIAPSVKREGEGHCVDSPRLGSGARRHAHRSMGCRTHTSAECTWDTRRNPRHSLWLCQSCCALVWTSE